MTSSHRPGVGQGSFDLRYRSSSRTRALHNLILSNLTRSVASLHLCYAGMIRTWSAGMDIPPSQTLYVQNVSDKLKKEMVKRQLYLAFSPFGRIMDVIACKGETLRGQAWVVYDSVNSATTALRSMNGFPFFGKPLVGDQNRDELC